MAVQKHGTDDHQRGQPLSGDTEIWLHGLSIVFLFFFFHSRVPSIHPIINKHHLTQQSTSPTVLPDLRVVSVRGGHASCVI